MISVTHSEKDQLGKKSNDGAVKVYGDPAALGAPTQQAWYMIATMHVTSNVAV